MGITVSFHRTRRKTGPLLISYRSSQDQSEIVDGKFDDINIEESNPFLASTRTTVVPNSLKQFIEVETKCQGQLNFYADGEISNVTVMILLKFFHTIFDFILSSLLLLMQMFFIPAINFCQIKDQFG